MYIYILLKWFETGVSNAKELIPLDMIPDCVN